ncbi:MAG: hypothetical protein K0R00_1345 [Herbinix sp.]|nr:hypothetical protein [Herbinix sp.]
MLWMVIGIIVLAITVMYLAIPGGRLWKQYLADLICSASISSMGAI